MLRRRQMEPTTSTTTTPRAAQRYSPPPPPWANCGGIRKAPSMLSSEAPNGPSNSVCSLGAMPGSVAITSPAIQPSSAAPAHTRTGSFASSAMISAAPATIKGTLMARPSTSKGALPLAAAATAMTLSRLMTMSATTTICTACHRCEADSTPSSSSCSGTSSFAAITISARPPTSLRYGSSIRLPTMPVKMIRSSTAAPAPRVIPHRRACTEDHAPQRMPRLEAAAGERDHQRIVAGQENVDPDDLADRDPEGRFGHLNAELGEECPDRSGIEDLPEPVHTTSFRRVSLPYRPTDQPTISLPEKNCAISIAAVSGASEPCAEFSPIDFA